MSGGYRVTPGDELNKLISRIDAIQNQVLELQRPDGGQVAGALAQVQALVGSLPTLVNNVLSVGFTTGSMHATGTAQVDGVFKNIAAYSNSISTSIRNVFVTGVDGQYGFNLSSGKYKQDIETAQVAAADVLKLRLVTYRYIAAVEEFAEAAAVEHGFIAEEVEAAGLGWLVDYDEDGEPLTLKFHLIGMAMLVVAQDQARELAESRGEIAELRARLDAAGL